MNYYDEIIKFLSSEGLTDEEINNVFRNIQELAFSTNTPLNELYRKFYINMMKTYEVEWKP